jgi:hypothetical protein
MRYSTAVLIPIAFVIAGFSLLAILTWAADGWNSGTQDLVANVLMWWGHYWWMLATVLAAVCMIVATISDAKAPAKRKP